MTYDFHRVIDRQHTASVKWELTKELFGSSDLLPMWVADMDFQPPQEVTEAIKARSDHGIYGYTYVPTSVAESIQLWLKNRHNWHINRSWLLYNTGVVPSICVAIQAFTEPGDKVMIQSPIYTPFFDMIEKNNRVVSNSPLQNINNRFEFNLEDMEEKLKEGAKLFLLCNPHNPGGRVWSEEELRTVAELCYKYDCLIVSDEIHSDLVFKPSRHTPIVSLEKKYEEIILTCVAPSKTFNLAGLQASAIIIPNEKLRDRFKAVQEKQGFFTLNTFGIIGMESAYRHGEGWLDQLLIYLKENVEVTKRYIEDNIPEITMMNPEGTYLIWLDCRNFQLSDEELKNALISKGKLALEQGVKYGPGGEGFVRMNIACSREVLLDGLERLKKAFI